MKKTLNILIGIAAGVTLLNYTVFLISLLIFPGQPIAYIITIIVLAATALPIIFRKQLKKILKKAYPVLKGIWAACLTFYVVSFAVMVTLIFTGSGTEVPPSELADDTVIIVYGAKINGTKENAYPGKALRYRLDYAADVMKDAEESVFIVCGGKGANEPCAEATVMKDYLVSIGIDEDRIFVDDESENTIENIDNAMKIIEDEGLSDRKVACLSTEFHVPRIKFLCGKAGLNVDYYFYAPSPNFFSLWSSLVREYMSYGKLILTGHL